MYTCSCTRTCTCRLWLGPGWTGACGMEGGPLGRRCGSVKVGDYQVRSTHTQAEPGEQKPGKQVLEEFDRAGVPQRERISSQATSNLPSRSPGCSLLTV